jgi:hypothetical protein
MFGAGVGDNIFPPDPNLYFTLSRCDVRTVDKEAHDLYSDFDVISNVIDVCLLVAVVLAETNNENLALCSLHCQVIDIYAITFRACWYMY